MTEEKEISHEERIAFYDAGAYRKAIQKLRDVRAAVNDMPEPQRMQVRYILQMFVHDTYLKCRAYREQGSTVNPLGPGARVLPLIRDALSATVEACSEIYERKRCNEKMQAAGSDSDYETDKGGLDELLCFFEQKKLP